MSTAKIFWTGRSQAVRLPKEFRFDVSTVRISQHGQNVILEPISENWDWLKNISGKLDRDFIDSVNEKSTQQSRPELDEFFK